MSRLRFFSVLGLLVAVVGCGGPAIPPSSSYAIVQGVVSDATTGKPVAGAVVTINEVLASAPTGADGSFVVHTVPSGAVDYSVIAAGYAPAQNTLTVTAGATMTLNISLSKS